MTYKSGVTVNGVMLEEFVRDNEQIEEEVERARLIEETTEKIYLNRHIRSKHVAHKEPNGKVKILSRLEISITNYEPLLVSALKKYDYHKAFIIVMMVEHGKLINIHKIADYIDIFSEAHEIDINPKMRHALRAKLGYVKKSELFDYMEYMDRKDPKNRENYAKFMLDSEKAKDLTIEKAIELGSSLRPGQKYNPGPKVKPENIPPTKTSMPKTPTEEIKITEEKQIDKMKSISDSVVSSITDIIKNGSLVNVQGDIHIHINIRS